MARKSIAVAVCILGCVIASLSTSLQLSFWESMGMYLAATAVFASGMSIWKAGT